jgi:TAK1-binding protein 1
VQNIKVCFHITFLLKLILFCIVTGSRLGNQENTRCLGNYLVKGGYKEFDELMSAKAEPVIAEPEIHGGIELDESCRYSTLNMSVPVTL